MLLIVDDERDVLRGLERMARAHVEVHGATTAKEALDIASRWNVTMALVDWTLPDGDGLELIKHLRAEEQERDIACALITGGDPDNVVTEKLHELDAPLLLKPIETATVGSFIARARERNALDDACRKSRLSKRHRQLVQWSARGRRIKSFADYARISYATVRAHAREICRRTGFRNIRAFVESVQNVCTVRGRL